VAARGAGRRHDEPCPPLVEDAVHDLLEPVAEGRGAQEDVVGREGVVPVVRIAAVPVVEIGGAGDAEPVDVLVHVAVVADDREMDVPGALQERQVERARQPQVRRVAPVVEGEAPACGVDQVDAARCAVRGEHMAEVEALFRVRGEHLPALDVVAQEVDELGGEAQRVPAQCHAVAGVPHVVAHRGNEQ
jgi:hypothetical protein